MGGDARVSVRGNSLQFPGPQRTILGHRIGGGVSVQGKDRAVGSSHGQGEAPTSLGRVLFPTEPGTPQVSRDRLAILGGRRSTGAESRRVLPQQLVARGVEIIGWMYCLPSDTRAEPGLPEILTEEAGNRVPRRRRVVVLPANQSTCG